jgi:hypothetical protein
LAAAPAATRPSCRDCCTTTARRSTLWPAQHGVAAIYAYGDISTPEGIELGSTYDQVHAAYPAWQGIEGKQGHGLVTVPSNSNAKYRIDISSGHVVELDIQLTDQDCYE